MVNNPNNDSPQDEEELFSVAIPEWEIQVVDSDEDLLPEEQTLMARIPYLAGNSKKVAYLAYRSVGFTVGQSCELAGCTQRSISNWRKKDPIFKKIEDEQLGELQKTVGPDVLKFEFMRNMKMLLRADMQNIAKGLTDVNGMSPREYELYKLNRKYYTASEILAIEKIINPEKHAAGAVTFNLTWGTRVEVPQIEGTGRDIEDGEFTESSDM